MEDGEQPNVTRSFRISGMPMGKYLEWKKSAIEEFGDCHWLKCISDHETTKQIHLINLILERIDELEQKIEVLANQKEEPKEEEKKEVKTFGGKENEN